MDLAYSELNLHRNPFGELSVAERIECAVVNCSRFLEHLKKQRSAIQFIGDEGGELLPFSAGARAICVERDAESDAYLHENVVVEQFKLLQPLFSKDLKQALISELVGSLMEG